MIWRISAAGNGTCGVITNCQSNVLTQISYVVALCARDVPTPRQDHKKGPGLRFAILNCFPVATLDFSATLLNSRFWRSGFLAASCLRLTAELLMPVITNTVFTAVQAKSQIAGLTPDHSPNCTDKCF